MTSPVPGSPPRQRAVECVQRMSVFGRGQIKKRRSFCELRPPNAATQARGWVNPYNERRWFLCLALQEAKGGRYWLVELGASGTRI